MRCTAPDIRLREIVGTPPGFPSSAGLAGRGRSGGGRCPPVAPGRGGGPVVVRGRESRLHGEGVQRIHACEVLQGTEALVNAGEPWLPPAGAEARVRRMQAKLHLWAAGD